MVIILMLYIIINLKKFTGNIRKSGLQNRKTGFVKGLLSFFAGGFLFFNCQAQTIVTEGFQNGYPPAGWSFNSYATSGNYWAWNQGYGVSSTTDKCVLFQHSASYSSDAWIFTAGYTLNAGITYRLSYWYNAAFSNTSKFKVTTGLLGTKAGQSTVLHDYPVITNTSYAEGIDFFTPTANGMYKFGFNAYGNPVSSLNGLFLDSIVLQQVSGVSCNSAPTPVSISGPSIVCPGKSFTLNSTSTQTAGGIAYQWQASPAGLNNFSNIAGAYNDSCNTTQPAAATDYRCMTTCINTGQASFSNVLTVNAYPYCYCIPDSTDCSQNSITKVVFAGIDYSTACGASRGYSDYTTTSSPANITANGNLVPISITVTTGVYKIIEIWIDYNINGAFETTERVVAAGLSSGTLTRNIQLPVQTTGGLTRMRVRMNTYGYENDGCTISGYTGETEDYAVMLNPFVCSGTPVITGGVFAPPRACADTAFNLSITGGNYIGYNLQWERSPAGLNNFTAIPGATTVTYSITQTATTDYRCVVTCAASGLSATSALRTVVTPALCYCLPSSSCISASRHISNVTFGGINNNSGCTSSQAGTTASGYADYTATLPTANITAGTTVPLSVSLASTESGSAAAWIDFNQNGVFETNEFKFLGSTQLTINSSFFIPSNANQGLTRMRIRRKIGSPILTAADACQAYSLGETEDYAVNIAAAPVVIHFTAFADTLYDKIVNVTARIVQNDVGLNTSDSLKPRIWVKRYGSSVWKKFSGNFISGTNNDGNWQFPVNHDSLGIRKNGCDSVQYYFVAQDLNTPSYISYLPEPGGLHQNVQVQINPPPALLGYRLKPRLKDTVYVSGTNCRFTSLTSNTGLFKHINEKQLEGDLTIVIESDLTENGLHLLTGYGLNGYKLAIRPAANNMLYTITTTSLDYPFGIGYSPKAILRFDSLKNVTIDGSVNGAGRFLKINNPLTSSQLPDTLSCISIYKGCDSITIKNLIFQHSSYGYGLGGGESVENSLMIRGAANKNIFIINNYFTSAPTQWDYISERHILASGQNNNVVVKHNQFNNFTQAAIQMKSACDNWIIDSNHFYRQASYLYSSAQFKAIDIAGSGHYIANNYIGGKAPFCGGQPMNPQGISLVMIHVKGPAGSAPVYIGSNYINNIDMGVGSNYRSGSFSGIAVSENNAIVENNVIGNPQGVNPEIIVWVNSFSGISCGNYGASTVRNNIVYGITNKAGSGPDYDEVTMAGIGASGASVNFTGSYTPHLLIYGNTISNIFNNNNAVDRYEYPGTSGIYLTSMNNDSIVNNTIKNIKVNVQSVAGISLNSYTDYDTAVIKQNRIYDLHTSALYNVNLCGIRFTTKNYLNIYNNQVSINNNNLVTATNVYGIYERGFPQGTNPNINVAYNSIYLGGKMQAAAKSAAYLFNIDAYAERVKRNIYNNIFYNERFGGTKGNYIYCLPTQYYPLILSQTVLMRNFCVLTDTLAYALYEYTGPSLPPSDTAYSYSRWSNWQNTDDSVRISLPFKTPADSFFINKNIGNLNIDSLNLLCWRVNEKAKPFLNIDGDFDVAFNVRSVDSINGKTDIGADEFVTSIPEPPFKINLCPGGSTVLKTNVTAATYQWELNDGTGFINISDNSYYTGTNSSSLQMSNLPSAWYGYNYRCKIGSSYSSVFTLNFENSWTGRISTAWENAANWSCGSIPDGNTDVVIPRGAVLLSTNGICRTIYFGPATTFTAAAGALLTVTH